MSVIIGATITGGCTVRGGVRLGESIIADVGVGFAGGGDIVGIIGISGVLSLFNICANLMSVPLADSGCRLGVAGVSCNNRCTISFAVFLGGHQLSILVLEHISE